MGQCSLWKLGHWRDFDLRWLDTLTCLKVTGYHEGAWFKNNSAKVFSGCNYYARVATTSNVVSFRRHGHTLRERRDRVGILLKFSPYAF